MTSVGPKKKTRGHSIPIPKWWMDELAKQTDGRVVAEVAADLQHVAPRQPAWTREVVRDFLNGDTTTLELMEAFCVLFKVLLPPVFFPQSPAEAYALLVESSKHRAHPEPEKAARTAVLNEVRDRIEKSASDQIERLDSVDEGRTRSRRPRGVARGRSSTS